MSHKRQRITTVAYAVNGSGLGHLTRVLAILRWMKRLARLAGAQLDAYVLTSSEAPGLALEEGFAAFKIPSKTAVREAGLPKEDYLRLARQWVWHSLGLIKPDLLLVDTFPGGSFGELIHALDAARSRVFIHRAMKAEFARSESVQALLPFYDRILIPVERQSSASSQEVDPRIVDRVRHTGPIMLRSREEMRPRDEARRRLGIPDGKLGVWLSAGGGGDAMAERAINALVDPLADEPDLHLVVGAGPLYRGAPRRGTNLTWVTGFHAMEDFGGLDFSISAAGYNSFHELLHAGVPTAFFAQEKIADEQSRRVRAAHEAGCALALATEGRQLTPRADEVKRVVRLLRDGACRAALAEKAAEFAPTNDARDAAFEALATILPLDALEEALDLGSPGFFIELARRDVELDEAERALKRLGAARELDAEERRELILRLIREPCVNASLALRYFQAFARHFPAPATESEAEALVEATLRMVRAAAPCEDERATLELLRALPRNESLRPDEMAAALCDFFDSLRAMGESIWRGRTILARQLEKASVDESPAMMLRAAAAEVRQEVLSSSSEAAVEVQHGNNSSSRESYDAV
jgi:UDP-N-acetylglucosamine--N-acetylmuramyl-(pentapeptide) pyrophosphoryl-undecaprenol N-acetylglucosamine transferase